MLAGLSWEWLVLAACAVLLLPRLVGVLANVVLLSALQSQPGVRVSIAGISLRRVTEIRVELLRVPLSPLLAARILVSVDEVALTPTWSKWLTVAVRGVKAHLVLSDVAPPLSHSSASHAASAGAASQPAAVPPRKLSRSAPTSIPDLLSSLSSAAPSATLPPVQRGYQYLCNRLLIAVFHAVAVQLSSVLVIAQKDQCRASARLASLLVYVDRASSNSSRLQQLHVKLGGLELRLGTTAEADMMQYPAIESDWTSTFTTKQRPSSGASFEAAGMTPSTAVPSLRGMSIAAISAAPPLLVLHPLLLMVEFTLHRYVPTGITRVETRAQGLSVHIDAMRLVGAASTALQAFHGVIVSVQRQMQDAANATTDGAVAAKASVASPSGPLGSPVLPINARGISFVPPQTTREAALHRDHMLRFIPTSARVLLQRVSVAVYERENNALASLASSMPSDLYSDLIARYGTSVAQAESSSSLPLTPAPIASPILRYLELHWSLMAVQADMKTRSPIPDKFTEVLSSYDNHLSSVDVSLTIARGPSLYLSNAKKRPLLDVHSLKFDWTTTPALAVSGSEKAYHASSSAKAAAAAATAAASEDEAPTSLFHPLGTIEQQNTHAISLMAVTTSIQLHTAVAHWLSFGLSVASAVDILALLVPAIDDRRQREEEARESAEQYQRYMAREQLRRREDSASRSRQHTVTQLFDREAMHVGVGAWRSDRERGRAPEAMVVRWKQPSDHQHHREAEEQEMENMAQRRKQGCQHHVVFTVKLISGLQLSLCSALPGDKQPVLVLALDEVNVRLEREPYRHAKHSRSEVYAQSDAFVSLFSKAVIPYSQSHKPDLFTASATSSSSPSSAFSPSSSAASLPASTAFSSAPREHINVSLTSLAISLPHDAQTSSFLPAHPMESVKQQHRIGSLSSASLTIDKGSPDIVLEADTLAVKYTAAVLGVFPHVFDLLLAIVPPQLLPGFTPPPPSPSYAAPPAPPMAPSLITASYPVPQVYLKCSVRNITVDFPYSVQDTAEAEPAASAPIERRASDASAANAPAGAAADHLTRSTRLFTYSCGQISVSVHLPTSAWSLALKHSYMLNELAPFMTIQQATISGTNPTATLPKSLTVTAHNVEGEWTPPVFVDLFKLIKDMIAAAVNMKHDMFGPDGLRLVPLLGSEARPVLDWHRDPILSVMTSTGKRRHADVFRLWYHYQRAPYLSEPYMWVQLDVRSVRLAAYLDAEETLSAFVALDSFSSRNIPHEFVFTGITVDLLQHPLVHVDSVSLNRIGMPLFSPDSPPPVSFTEEHNLAGDLLDLALVMRNVRLELSPKMDLGPLLDPIMDKVAGLLDSLIALPSIDRLSRELGGPGYGGALLPPAPGLTMRVEGLQLEVVDEPMESFLQHLHLLWLDERNEQERRRALLQLKLAKRRMGQSAEAVQATIVQIEANAGDDTMSAAGEDEASLREALAEYNSRMYVAKVEQLKRSMREGESLKKASLLLCSLDKLSVDAGMEGELGSFHDDEVLDRLIRQYSAEEATVWEGEGVEMGGRSRASTQINQQHDKQSDAARQPEQQQQHQQARSVFGSPASSIASTASLTGSPIALSPSSASASAGRSLSPVPGTMLGRYVRVQVDVVQLRLRNFPLPLFSCSQVTVSGHTLLGEMVDDQRPHEIGTGASPLMAPTPAAGSRTVKLSLCSRPKHMFYDLAVGVSAATVAFSPHFAYTLNDVVDSMQRVAPPLPPVMYAVSQPVPPRPAGSGDVDVAVRPVNLVHFARSFLHGRLSLAVSNIALHLLSSPSPYETARFLQLHVQSVALSTDGPLVGLKVEDVDVIPVPHQEGQPSLLELPSMECWFTVNWHCKDEAHRRKEDEECDLAGLTDYMADERRRRVLNGEDDDTNCLLPPADAHRRASAGRNLERKDMVLDEESRTRLHHQRPPALTQIVSHKAAAPGSPEQPPLSSSPSSAMITPCIDHASSQLLTAPSYRSQQQQQQQRHRGRKQHAPLQLVASDGFDHSCRLHISLSVSFAPAAAAPAPLSLTLHASSLGTLFHLGKLYSAIPPLPLPKRRRLAQYYLRYHAGRIQSIAANIMREMDVRGARLLLLDNNINDDMIGMVQRGELDGSIFRRMLDSLAHSPGATQDQIVQTLLAQPFSHAPSPASCAAAASSQSPALAVVLSGVYVERLSLSQLLLTMWEGENHGPASGLRLSIEQVDVVCELQEEAGMAVVPPDALKHSKIYLPLRPAGIQGGGAGKAGRGGDDMREVSKGYDYTRASLSRDVDLSPAASPLPGSHSPRQTHSVPTAGAATSDVPDPLIWSLSNLAVRVSAVQAEICHNAKWLELSHEHEASPLTAAATSSRVVLATYENERYTLGQGWSERNLLPTDRAAWSNATGSEEVSRDSIKLPSDDWEWEGDWQLDFDLRKTGEVDEEGWEYCNVRRRRWVRVRRLKASLRDGAVETDVRKRRKKKKMENAHNFVLSVSLLSVHQRPYLHRQQPQRDDEAAHLDWRRGLFRRKVIGRRVRGVRNRGRTDDAVAPPNMDAIGGQRSSSNLLLVSHMPSTRRAQSISSTGYSAADTSLLSYFHIRNALDDSILDEDEAGVTSAIGSQRGTSALGGGSGERNPLLQSQSLRTIYSETLSPVSPAPSPSLSRVAVAQQAPSTSSAPSSPLLALPTQHQIRVHDPKLLFTSDTRSMLATLAEQYGAAVQELVAADREWLDRCRKLERERDRTLAAEEAETGSDASSTTFHSFNPSRSAAPSSMLLGSVFAAPSAETPTNGRRGSFSVESTTAPAGSKTVSSASTSTRSSPLMRRPRLASAEEASRRSTLPLSMDHSPLPQQTSASSSGLSVNTRYTSLPLGAKLPNVRDSSSSSSGTSRLSVVGAQPSQQLPAIHDPDTPLHILTAEGDAAAAPPTATLPIAANAVPIAAATVRFNCDCHVMEAATQSEAQELFCIEIINPQLNCHSEETRGRLLLMTSHITLYGRVDWVHSLHLPHQDSPYATRGASFFAEPPPPLVLVQATSTKSALPIVSRDKFRVTAVLDGLEAFVAPTDIDVDAGVVWMNKQNVGVLKSILQPATLQVNASFRPEVMPVTAVTVPDKAASPQQLEDKLQVTLNGRNAQRQDSNSARKATADTFSPTSNALLPPVLSAGRHHVVFSHSDSNQVDVALPELTFALDAYQFSLLLDVIKVISSPPATAELKDGQVGEVDDAPIEQLQHRAARQQIRLFDLVWEMKWIEWLIAGVDKARDNWRRESSSASAASKQAAEVDDAERQLQAGSATSLGSFQSWLIDATQRMDHAKQERDHSNLIDQAYVGVHQRFDVLLTEHNRLLSEFLNLLLAIRVKKAAQTQTMLHHLQAAVRCERINYQLVKHEKPSLTLYIEQLAATAAFAPDATVDLVAEVKAVGGRVLLPHYADPSRAEHAWQEMIALYVPDKTADSAWRDVMLHAHFTGRFDRTAQGSREDGEAVIHLAELNLHPIAVRLTYEGIMLVVDYFVTEQSKLSKQSAAYRDTFLPLSQAVLDVDGEVGATSAGDKERQLLGIAAGGGGSVPHSPKGAGDGSEHRRRGMKDRMKGISHFFHRDRQHSQHSQSMTLGAHSGEADDDLLLTRADDDRVLSMAAAASLAGSGNAPTLAGNVANLPRPIAPAPPHHHSHSLSTSASASTGTSSSGGGGTSGGSSSVSTRSVLSSLSGDADEKSVSGASSSVPPTPSAASLATRKALAGRSSATATAASSGTLTDADRDALLLLQRTDASSSSTAAASSGSASKKPSTSSSSPASSSPLLYVNYLRLGASVLSLSYLSGGSKKYNIEDFQGLAVHLKPFTLQKRELTAEQLLKELKNQQLKALLRQVTATMGNFLSYKLGFSRPQQQAAQSSSAASASPALMGSVEESREGDDDVDAGGGAAASAAAPLAFHAPSGSSALSLSAEPAPALSRSSLRSGLASVGSKLGESRVRALFGDKGKKKDSDGRDRDAAASAAGSSGGAPATSAASSSFPPAPPVPPRPLSAVVAASSAGSLSALSTAGVHISAPVAAAAGRTRSVSSGDRAESRSAALSQSGSANALASTHLLHKDSSPTAAHSPAPAPFSPLSSHQKS